MALHVKYDPDTGEIVWPLKPGEMVAEFDIAEEQLEGATVERQRKGGHPAAIRLADDTIVEENWP
jgi:hypothetical protein